VTALDPCTRGLLVTWDAATWRAGSAGGLYHLFRRAGSCRPPDDPSWELVATDLTDTTYLDPTIIVGVAYSYLVEAEDEAAPVACPPGRRGGPADWACGTPEAVADPGDPDASRLISLSPFLRAVGYEQDVRGGPATAVTFTWALAPARDRVTFVDVWRSPWADSLRRHAPRAPGDTWRDPSPTEARLLFYKVFNVTECGTPGE
jgi:hypothetical protein